MLNIVVIKRFNDLKKQIGKTHSPQRHCVLRASAVNSLNRSQHYGRATSRDLEDKLQSPQQLPRVKCRSEAERVTGPEISIFASGEPHCAGSVILRRLCRRKCKDPGSTDRDRDELIYHGKVCAIEQIRCVCCQLEPHRTVLFEAERFTEPQVDAAIVRPESGIAADVE